MLYYEKTAKDGDGMGFTERKPNRIPEFDYSIVGAYFGTLCTHGRKATLSAIVGAGSPVPNPTGMIAIEYIRQDFRIGLGRVTTN